jgi:hypothetical protein
MQKKQLTKKQEARLNSYRSTEQLVDANLSIIAVFAAFLLTYNKIKANIAAIIVFEAEKAASIAGYASGKNIYRKALCKLAAIIAGLVYTYAEDTENEVLRNEMDLNYSDINRTRDDELPPLCQLIHDRADAIAEDVRKDYNIQTEDIAELQTLLESYSAESPKPRTAVSTRKTTIQNIAAIFHDNDQLFKKFDKQIESLRKTHPDFVTTYFSNREFVNPPTKSKKPKDTENKAEMKKNEDEAPK